MEVYTVSKGGFQKGLPSYLPVDSSVSSSIWVSSSIILNYIYIL